MVLNDALTDEFHVSLCLSWSENYIFRLVYLLVYPELFIFPPSAETTNKQFWSIDSIQMIYNNYYEASRRRRREHADHPVVIEWNEQQQWAHVVATETPCCVMRACAQLQQRACVLIFIDNTHAICNCLGNTLFLAGGVIVCVHVLVLKRAYTVKNKQLFNRNFEIKYIYEY